MLAFAAFFLFCLDTIESKEKGIGEGVMKIKIEAITTTQRCQQQQLYLILIDHLAAAISISPQAIQVS